MFRTFPDILESEDDIPSPAYSPYRLRRKTSAILKKKKKIAGGKQKKESQAQKGTKKKKNVRTKSNKENRC